MKQVRYVIPKRVYCDGQKKMVSMRLPVKLWSELEKLAKDKGWNTTELVTTALDQLLQWSKKKGI